jgi:hypothetical protein
LTVYARNSSADDSKATAKTANTARR